MFLFFLTGISFDFWKQTQCGNYIFDLNGKMINWAFLIACCRCQSVRLSVNFSHFHLLLQNHWANFNQTWHKYLYLWMGFKFAKLKRPHLFPRGYNNEIAKIHWWNLKIFFTRTTGPISTKLGTMHPWMKGV